MLNLENLKNDYLEVCKYQKGLNQKTLKAYRIDLNQFEIFAKDTNNFLSRDIIQSYVMSLHKTYKPKTAKRKIASLKAFCTYLFFTEIITENPFAKINIKYQDPQILPKTIPFTTLQNILSTAHKSLGKNCPFSSYHSCLRDVAVLELLFEEDVDIRYIQCMLGHSSITTTQIYTHITSTKQKEILTNKHPRNKIVL